MLLLSKADLLTPTQRYCHFFTLTFVIHLCYFRDVWANYFDKEGISYAFWSAHLETAKFEACPLSGDKEESCVDGGHGEEDQESDEEVDEELGLLPQTMTRGFILEDECATMATDHEPPHETPQQTIDNNITKTNETICSDTFGRHEESVTEDVTIATLPLSQSGVVDDTPLEHEATEPPHINEESNGEQIIPINEDCPNGSKINQEPVESNSDTAVSSITNPRAKLLTCDELLDLFRSLCSKKVQKKAGEPVVIGMVGYPNVGKSSTINTLIQGKKVPVSATPGRTKHFQVMEDLLELPLHYVSYRHCMPLKMSCCVIVLG